jgi:hypothetical protein
MPADPPDDRTPPPLDAVGLVGIGKPFREPGHHLLHRERAQAHNRGVLQHARGLGGEAVVARGPARDHHRPQPASAGHVERRHHRTGTYRVRIVGVHLVQAVEDREHPALRGQLTRDRAPQPVCRDQLIGDPLVEPLPRLRRGELDEPVRQERGQTHADRHRRAISRVTVGQVHCQLRREHRLPGTAITEDHQAAAPQAPVVAGNCLHRPLRRASIGPPTQRYATGLCEPDVGRTKIAGVAE